MNSPSVTASSTSSVNRRVLFYILLCSSTVTLLLTAVELYLEYRLDVGLLEQRMAAIEVSYLPSIRENLWLYNSEVVQSQIQGIANLTDIVQVVIYDETGAVLHAVGDNSAEHLVRNSYALIHSYQGKEVTLGQLEVWATLENIYTTLRQRLMVILLGQGFKTFLVSFLILLIMHRVVTARVAKISRQLASIDLATGSAISGHRSVQQAIARPGKADDELDDLAYSIDAMHGKVSQLYQQSNEQRRKLKSIFEGSHDAILIIELERCTLVDFNAKALELLGFSKQELQGLSFFALYSGAHQHVRELIDTTRRMGWELKELTFKSVKGELIPTETSLSLATFDSGEHLVAVCRDIRERNHQQAEIDRMAHFDTLTGLPNRLLMRDRIDQSLRRHALGEHSYLVMIVDIDHFKQINDALGQGCGDMLIKTVASLVEKQLPEGASLGRLSSDEFLLLVEFNDPEQSLARQEGATLAEQIRASFAEQLPVAGEWLKVSVSVGCAVLGEDGESFDMLLRHVDLALCKAKADGRDRVEFFNSGMDLEASRKLALQTDLHRAYKQQEFELFYQPIVDLDTGTTRSVECLLRWRKEDGSLVSPAEFIPALVSSGLIVDVGGWVIETACREMARQPQPRSVAVNVSPCQLDSDAIIFLIEGVLADTGLPPELLVLEITEDLIIQDKGWAIERLNRLHRMGVRIALDDFGTGYSSLSYLKMLPVDKLKIDQSFVRDMLTDPEDSAIVTTIISMAGALGLELIAEGVETQQQADQLRQMGCQLVQGYFYQRPQPDLALSLSLGGEIAKPVIVEQPVRH